MAGTANDFDDMASLFGESPPPESEIEETEDNSHARIAMPNPVINQGDQVDDVQSLSASSPSPASEDDTNGDSKSRSYGPDTRDSANKNGSESVSGQHAPPLNNAISQFQTSDLINNSQSILALSEVSDGEEADRVRKRRQLADDDGAMRYSLREGARQKHNDGISIFGFPYIPDFDKSGTYDPANHSEPESVISYRIGKSKRKKRVAETNAPTTSQSTEARFDNETYAEDQSTNKPASDDTPTLRTSQGNQGSLRMVFKFREPAKGVLRRIQKDITPYAHGFGQRGHDNWPSNEEGYLKIVDFQTACSDIPSCHRRSIRPRDIIDTKADPRLKDISSGDPAARGCKQCVCLGITCSLVGGGQYECEACKEMKVACELVTKAVLKTPCENCKSNPVYYNHKGMRRRVRCEYVKTPLLARDCICCKRRGLTCIAGPLGGTTRQSAACGDDARQLRQKFRRFYRHGMYEPIRKSLPAPDNAIDAADLDADSRPWQSDDDDTLFVQPDLGRKSSATGSEAQERYRSFFKRHKGFVGKVSKRATTPSAVPQLEKITQNELEKQSQQQTQQPFTDKSNEHSNTAAQQQTRRQLPSQPVTSLLHELSAPHRTESASHPIPQDASQPLSKPVSQPVLQSVRKAVSQSVPQSVPQSISQSIPQDVPEDMPRDASQPRQGTQHQSASQNSFQPLHQTASQSSSQSKAQSESQTGQTPVNAARPSKSTASASTQPKRPRISRAPHNGRRSAKTRRKAQGGQDIPKNPRLSFHWTPNRLASGPHARPLSVETVIRGGDSEDENFAK